MLLTAVVALGLFGTQPVQAQVDTAWVRLYKYVPNAYSVATDVAVDQTGNVYVTGISCSSEGLEDFATIKYSPAGETLWVRTHNGPGTSSADWVNDIALDNQGNVYVTGMSEQNRPAGEDDYATVKYDRDGVEQWVAVYNHPDNDHDEAYALAIDNSGYVYVTGMSGNSSYATIKYRQSGAITERPVPGFCSSTLRPTVVRGVLVLPHAASCKLQATSLLDIGGRRALDLQHGPNDVSRLAPGVYFVRRPADAAVIRVVVIR
jgi:hypothetical protein